MGLGGINRTDRIRQGKSAGWCAYKSPDDIQDKMGPKELKKKLDEFSRTYRIRQVQQVKRD
jgi:hypothetical protein